MIQNDDLLLFSPSGLTRGSSGCLRRPTTLIGISSFLFVGIVKSAGGSGSLEGASLRSTTASCVSKSALRCALSRRFTSSLACKSLDARNAWHTSSMMSQTDEHTGSTGTGGSSRRSCTWHAEKEETSNQDLLKTGFSRALEMWSPYLFHAGARHW